MFNMNHIINNIYNKMKILTNWKDGRKDEVIKMTDKKHNYVYGMANCLQCNKQYVRKHHLSELCSDECKKIRAKATTAKWLKKRTKRLKEDPEYRNKLNNYYREKRQKEKSMIDMTKVRELTIDELEQIKQLLDEGKTWSTIRDNMFYSYEHGYIMTTQMIQNRYYNAKYSENDPINPTFGKWSTKETATLIGMWNAGIPQKYMTGIINRTYRQISGKISSLKRKGDGVYSGSKLLKMESLDIRNIRKKKVEALSPPKRMKLVNSFKSINSSATVKDDNTDGLETGTWQTSVGTIGQPRKSHLMNWSNDQQKGPYPDEVTQVKTKSIINLSKENKILKKTNESLMKALVALEEAMVKTEETSTEIHNTNLKTEQGNPTIVDDDGNQIDKTAQDIVTQCQFICDLLLSKNKQYGDSVSNPIRVFSKADSSEQIKVRIDDKISRLVRGDDSLETDEDIIDDLIGYLILLKIQMKK